MNKESGLISGKSINCVDELGDDYSRNWYGYGGYSNGLFHSNYGAIAVLKKDGSVVVWGSQYNGGNPGEKQSELNSGVVKVIQGAHGFSAIKEDGSLVVWGSSGYGGDPGEKQSELNSGIVSVYTSYAGYAAIKEDGKLVYRGGYDPGEKQSLLNSGVTKVYSNTFSNVALKEDGSVVVWGDGNGSGEPWNGWGTYEFGGDPREKQAELNSGVVSIHPGRQAFAALKEDGSVVTWGYSGAGGDPGEKQADLNSGVVFIYSSVYVFVAIKEDGSVVTWGATVQGGDSSSVEDQLFDIVSINGTCVK